MDTHHDVDAWADRLLDQHRTVPRGEAKRLNELAPEEELLPATRLAMKLGAAHPTREQNERIRRAARRQAVAANWEMIVTAVGMVLLAGLLLFGLSMF